MGILDSLKKGLFGERSEDKLMKSINAPIFLKDFDIESNEIKELKKLLDNTSNENTRKKLENEINLQKYVHDGLGKVYYELKSSSVPFYGLYDLKLKVQDQGTNIDFLCLTNRFLCVVKVKSMQGNIEIDKQGSFSRWMKKGDKWHKEGIYSPLEQNRKSETFIKSVLKDEFNIVNMPIHSMVVFTNSKATLNFKECSEDILDKVFKFDLINTKLKEIIEKTNYQGIDEKLTLVIAERFKQLHIAQETDYASKFNITEAEKIEEAKSEVAASLKTVEAKETSNNVDIEYISNALKTYRTAIATSSKFPPYYVFNNEELDRILQAMPKTKEELLKVKGFGPVKVDKYGEDILKIIND
jgi:hypothetical protein